MHKYFSMIFRYFVIFTLIIGGNNSFSNEPQANESELQISERVSIIQLTLEAKERERQRKEIKDRHKEERRELKDRHRTERYNTRGEERRELKDRHREERREIKARHRTERRDRERTFGSDAESGYTTQNPFPKLIKNLLLKLIEQLPYPIQSPLPILMKKIFMEKLPLKQLIPQKIRNT